MNQDRVRQRQGEVVVVDGVPLASADTTLSLLPLDILGEWLADNASVIHGRLLDLGAGNQPYRPWYEPLTKGAVAVDVVPAPGLDVLTFSAPLPFRDSLFDVVLCTSVLEHVDDPERTVAEIHRVLRPDGCLVISAPFLYPTHEAPYDYWRTTYYGLQLMLERQGLVVESMAAQGGPLVLVAHYFFRGLGQGLSATSRRLPALAGILDSDALRSAIGRPQRALRKWTGYRLTAASQAVSLGYMVVARKPRA